MDIVQMENTPVADTPHKVDVRKLYDTENAMTVHITLQPGESLKKHITPVDVFFYVLEGTGIVEIGDEKKEVGKDTLIDSPARIPHCWYNESEDVLRFLVVKVPRPTTETKLL
jgi:mannose-6-phosphate isomerase-like protein (cupin superfamily)